MEIWAHTLVKNDARWLWYSVNSVIEYVDKLLLWDTGSTDSSLRTEEELVKKFPSKILFKQRPQKSKEEFTEVRQEMLEVSKCDWFFMLDGDEIWWRDSVNKVMETILAKKDDAESIIVPTINVVGDIFHFQDKNAGKYRFGNLFGHYNLRAINRKIPGLHSQGVHGVWGWADADERMIQDRNADQMLFVDAPYLHTTFLKRSDVLLGDSEVVKRNKKFKHETGIRFPLDFYYPEAFFVDRPDFIESPWSTPGFGFRARSLAETPLRNLKRSIFTGKAGY